MAQRHSSESAPGPKEQHLLHEDPARLIQDQAPDDPTQQANIEERRSDRARREFALWWKGLSPERVLELADRRDELLALLHERYGYSRQEAEVQVEELVQQTRRPDQ